MSKYILSPNAQKSLRNIKTHSKKQFGDRQTAIYIEDIKTKLKYVANDPDKGRNREDVKRGYLSYLAGSHVIFYRKAKTHIDIIDILHQSMEPTLHLGDEE